MLSLELVIQGLSTQCYLYHRTSRATALFEKNLDMTVAMAETNSALRYQEKGFWYGRGYSWKCVNFPISRNHSVVQNVVMTLRSILDDTRWRQYVSGWIGVNITLYHCCGIAAISIFLIRLWLWLKFFSASRYQEKGFWYDCGQWLIQSQLPGIEKPKEEPIHENEFGSSLFI